MRAVSTIVSLSRRLLKALVDGTVALRSQGLLPSVVVFVLVVAGIGAVIGVWRGESVLTILGWLAIVLCSGYGAACKVAILNEDHAAKLG